MLTYYANCSHHCKHTSRAMM